MAINLAARRGAKNQRRKAAVAQKRKAEMQAGTLAGRVRLALADPIQHCLLTEGLFDTGIGTLIVARGATPYGLTLAGFLVDIHALGVKDVFLTTMTGKELADYLDRLVDVAPAAAVDPSYARKLLHDLVYWARTLGFAPHRDYPKLELIFGDISAAACDAEFHFGFEGKPLLVGDEADIAGRLAAQGYEFEIDGDDVEELSEQVTPA
jgi:hypothetical protein